MPRLVLSLTGPDRIAFLQGLVTNDVTRAEGDIVYAALLTPQGKFLADFFVVGRGDALLIDVDRALAANLAQRLAMYRLRADVAIEQTDLVVSRAKAPAPDNAANWLADPRHEAMGFRHYGDTDLSDDTDWEALRVAHVIPQSGVELTPETYILEAGFERLDGVDFRKGCYVGQEIAARMKHKTELKKGLVQVAVRGDAVAGTAVMAGEKEAGVLHTVSGDRAIAYLRFDRARGPMTAGTAQVIYPAAD